MVENKQPSNQEWDFSLNRSKEDISWFEKCGRVKRTILIVLVIFLTLASIAGAILILVL